MRHFLFAFLAATLVATVGVASAQENALARVASDVRITAFSTCLEAVENVGEDVVAYLYEESEPGERMLVCLSTSQDTRWRGLVSELPGWTAETSEDDLLTGTWQDPATDPPTNYRAVAVGSQLGRDLVAVVADRFAPVAHVEPFAYAQAVGDAVQRHIQRTRSEPASDCTAGYNPGSGFAAHAPNQPLASCTVKASIEFDDDEMSYEYEILYEDADGASNARSGAGFVRGDP
ncbi:MAG: hypothetical protein U5K81_14015 [Trueperaceae bacterium]|nr:hypothetical protein [Trueperaceae bacterium]